MRINIYQIDSEKDTNRVKFSGYDETMKHGSIISQNYKCVFRGDVDGDLEAVYSLFNTEERPGTYQGHSLSVSDIVEVIRDDTGQTQPGSYFVDRIGFRKLADFDSSQCAEMDGVRMLMIQPHQTPVVTYVREKLADLQRAVSDHCEEAYIEYTYPFDDDCIYENGKFHIKGEFEKVNSPSPYLQNLLTRSGVPQEVLSHFTGKEMTD